MGRNWSPKYPVQCLSCPWKGKRTRRCARNPCPRCGGTVNLVDKKQSNAHEVANRLMGSPNKAMCRICEDVIESKHRHDWVQCKGGHIFIDGGREYRRAGTLLEGVMFDDIIYIG